MAKDKETFILQASLIHTVEKLSDARAGILLKTILRYVGDLNPVIDDEVVDLVFESVKQQLKKDLVKWMATCERNQTNGQKGGRPKNPSGLIENPKNPSGYLETHSNPLEPDMTVIVNGDNDLNNSLSLLGGKSLFENPENKPRSEIYFENFKEYVKKNTIWWEQCQSSYGATEKEMLDFAKIWFFEQDTAKKNWKDESDLKSHFQNSFKIHKQKYGQSTKTSNGLNNGNMHTSRMGGPATIQRKNFNPADFDH